MNTLSSRFKELFTLLLFSFLLPIAVNGVAAERKFLYVAEPGVRNYLEYGGHGILVFDIDHGHKFVRRIATRGLDEKGQPLNVKGICANVATRRLYVSTTKTLMCLDLMTDKILWEKSYEGGCDRMSISPDGKIIYLPSLEGDHWHVVEAMNGEVLKKIVLKSAAHNTIYGLDGAHVYLAGRKSPLLAVVDARTREVSAKVGPFSNVIRPLTVNGEQTLVFVNVDELLGFEVGDLKTGKMLHRVEVKGYERGKEKRHGCPSHGIGMTPDEREIWLSDAANSRVHIFDATVMPPKQLGSIAVRDQPGWVTFSIDGRYAYPSTGDVIETGTRNIVARLKDEEGREVQSEKLLEIDFAGEKVVKVGDQFGLGRRLNQH
jgi:DNA-binding beta-propeller fold protein YncE